MKFAPSPHSRELDVLVLIVDDESSYPMDSSIVSTNVILGGMTDLYPWTLLVGIYPIYYTQGG